MTDARLLSRPSPAGALPRERLRTGTEDLHRRVEAEVDRADWFASGERYGKYLLRWDGLLTDFAQSLAAFSAAGQPGSGIADRREGLDRDLQDLALKPDVAPAAKILPVSRELAQAFGYAYVLEGSQLGGRILAKRVEDRLGRATPTRFLAGSRDRAGPRWLEFLSHLDAALEPQDRLEVAVGAARTAFQTVGCCLAG